MRLSGDNYYSQEANREYMSVSQYKDFAGSYGKVGCEAKAMAKLNGEYEEEKSTALLVGSYVDSYFEGSDSFEKFKANNPEILTQSGSLRSDYRKADAIIKRIESDDFFMMCMSGEKQTIMTGEIFGAKWKIKMDSYHSGRVIVDLKIIESIKKLKWVRDIGYLDFIRYWGYDLQGAIYQEIVYQNTGERLPFYIAAASKETVTDIQVIHVQDNFLREAMNAVQYNIGHILDVKAGRERPERCEVCDYCTDTKVLDGPISLLDLTAAV